MRLTELCDERLTNYLVRSELCPYIWAINEQQHAMRSTHINWLKLYDARGVFIASFRHAEDAALVATNYHGSTIRDGHQKRRTLWTEGSEVTTGGESADVCAKIIYDRLAEMKSSDVRRNAARNVVTGDALYPGRQFAKTRNA